MIFGQFINYNMRKIFVEKHAEDVVERLFPDSFLENQN